MQVVSLKINIDLIEQARLFQGQKGRYLDATLFLTDGPDAYGNNGMIVQAVSKEEREQGVRGPILGNAKVMGQKPPPSAAPAPLPLKPQPTAPKPSPKAKPEMAPNRTVPPEDLPF